ncbi:transposase, partial [Solitalea agri]
PFSEWLVCMEHTGVYVLGLSAFLQSRQITYALENPLQIKRSMGICRGKTDRADSSIIAQYALRFQDRLRAYQLPCATLQSIRILLGQRERLVNCMRQLELGMQSAKAYSCNLLEELQAANLHIMEQMKQETHRLDKQLQTVIQADETLKSRYELIVSVPGIGLQTAAYILLYTVGMKRFESPRQFACYCGVAPFDYRSGSSIRGKTRVHYLANRKLKSLLHLCSLNAVRNDPELKKYYERKQAEGKNAMSVLNAIRFKLICRVF